MLEIDSSRGEGGGQMVRTSVALSALTGIPTKLTRIRENRPTNGLSKQHTTAVDCVAEITGSTVEGNFLGSSELIFHPGNKKKCQICKDIGTAGSISLVMQAVMLAARNHPGKLEMDFRGGTNVMWAPPLDSYDKVLFPLMRRMGIETGMDIVERGFYPVGGGHATAYMDPIGIISPLDLSERGELKSIKGEVFIQHLPDSMAHDMIESCKHAICKKYDAEFQISRSEGTSRGAGMLLVAEYENTIIASNVLTSRGRTAHQSGEDVASDLLAEISTGATLDIHTADQLLPYMAMANGHSEFVVSKISKHLLSQMDTLESFLNVRFGVERCESGYRFTVDPEVEG